MKRIALALALATVAAGSFSGRLHAQAASQPAASTRVAIVNIGWVFSKYEKAKFYKQEMEEVLKPFRQQGEKLRKEIGDWAEAMKAPTFDQKERDRYERGILDNKRKMEDLEMQVRKLVGKKQEEQIVTLFREISGAVQAYAQANGYHLVLGYGEQVEGELYGITNVSRKMTGLDGGGTNPLFQGAGVEIAPMIVETLNRHYANQGGTTPARPTSLNKN